MARSVLARAVLARTVLVGLGAFAMPGPAAAHDGQPALIAEQNVAPPGGSIVVRGEDLGGEATVRLSLAGGVGVELGRFPTDGDGHIVLAIAIPPDLPPGEYELRGTLESGVVVGVAVRVDGAVVDPGLGLGGQGGRDEDDPLLVALPEGWQQSLSSPPAAETAPPIRGQGGENGSPPVGATDGTSVSPPLIGLVVLVGGAVALAMGRLLTGGLTGSQ